MSDARLTAVVPARGAVDASDLVDTVNHLGHDWPGWRVQVVTTQQGWNELQDLEYFDGVPRVCGLPGVLMVSPATDFAAACDAGWRATEADAVVFLAPGDRVRRGFAAALAAQFGPDVVAAYADYSVNGRRVFAEPCDRKRMFEVPYAPRAALISTAALRAIDGFDFRAGEAAWLDLWMRLTERGVAVHVPEALSDLTPAQPRTEAALRAAIQRTAARA